MCRKVFVPDDQKPAGDFPLEAPKVFVGEPPLVLMFRGIGAPAPPHRVQDIHRVSNQSYETKVNVWQPMNGLNQKLQRGPLMKMVWRLLDEQGTKSDTQPTPALEDQLFRIRRELKVRKICRQKGPEIMQRLSRRNGNFTVRDSQLLATKDRGSLGPVQRLVLHVPSVLDVLAVCAPTNEILQRT